MINHDVAREDELTLSTADSTLHEVPASVILDRDSRFDQKRGKLSPRYIGPFEILECTGKVAYRLALPPKMSGVHNVFHISMLRKCVHNPEHEIDFNDIEVNDNATYNEGLVRILDHGVKKLRNKEISLVKVQWKHHDEGEASWELESKI